MKTCSKCGISKPDSEYAYKVKRDGKKYSYCKACKNKYQRNYYKDNNRRPLVSSYNRRRRRGLISKVASIKSKIGCTDCGIRDPIVLDFDHVKGEKKSEISKMAKEGHGWDSILLEISKCEVRCSNCHRIKTYKNKEYIS